MDSKNIDFKIDLSSENFSDLSSKYDTSPHTSPKTPSLSSGEDTLPHFELDFQGDDNSDSKKEELSIDEYITIGTHNGRFHVDEVLACVIAKIMYNDKVIITRSRDHEVLDTCHILFDVGGEYNPKLFKFDHHQKDCNEKFDEASNIPLSSAGMAWKHFGKKIIQSLLTSHFKNRKTDSKFVERMYSEIYYEYILEIDANDNGISRLKDEVDAETTENYDFHFNLPTIVSNYNTVNIKNEKEQLSAFNDALNVVCAIFIKACLHSIDVGLLFWEDYDKFVLEYDQPDKLPSILNVSKYFKTYERILNQYDPQREFVKFIYFNPLSLSGNPEKGEWTVKTRTVPGKSFINVIDLAPEEELRKHLMSISNLSGNDLLFLHKNLFLAKCRTEDAALEITNYSLEKHRASAIVEQRKSDSLSGRVNILAKKINSSKIPIKQSVFVAGGALVVGILIGKFFN